MEENNGLKPTVFAYHDKKHDFYGVSLAVRSFVRPLYLYTKLLQLGCPGQRLKLGDVKAIKLKKNIPACVGCQYFYKGRVKIGIYPIGNCAEYEVLGNVHPELKTGSKWEQFKEPCIQHFTEYVEMLQELTVQGPDTLERYFNGSREPLKPKVLVYKWSSEKLADFELYVEDWPKFMHLQLI